MFFCCSLSTQGHRTGTGIFAFLENFLGGGRTANDLPVSGLLWWQERDAVFRCSILSNLSSFWISGSVEHEHDSSWCSPNFGPLIPLLALRGERISKALTSGRVATNWRVSKSAWRADSMEDMEEQMLVQLRRRFLFIPSDLGNRNSPHNITEHVPPESQLLTLERRGESTQSSTSFCSCRV